MTVANPAQAEVTPVTKTKPQTKKRGYAITFLSDGAPNISDSVYEKKCKQNQTHICWI